MDIATNAEILNRLAEAIDQARRSFYRLVLLVGPSGTGKTAILRRLAELQRCPYLNINLHLSQRMLELPRAKRPRHVDRIFNALIDERQADLLVVDNLEVLFDVCLHIDPLRLLKLASRQQTLVAAWNGVARDDGSLSYAEPDHPEYKSYGVAGGVIVPLATESTAGH